MLRLLFGCALSLLVCVIALPVETRLHRQSDHADQQLSLIHI